MSATSTAETGRSAPGEAGRAPMVLVGAGHCGTHWVAATLFTILPFVITDLKLSYTEAGFLVSVFHMTAALANVPSGIAVDVTGRRVVFQVVALAFGAFGLAAFGVASTPLTLALAVAVIGATNMLWHPAALSYLSLLYPERRGMAFAMHAFAANCGDALAPLAAGAMLAALGWQKTAIYNAIPVLAVGAVIFLLLQRTHARNQQPHVDTGGIRGYLDGMKTLLKRRAIWLLCLLTGFRSMTQYGLIAFLPVYLNHDMKIGPFWMGVAMTMLQIGGMVAMPLAGHWSDRIGRRPVIMAGLWATSIIIVALTFVSSVPLYVAGISLLGFCMYALRPVIHSWMMDMAPKELGASVTSMVFGTQSSLATLMPVIGGALADAYGLVSVFYFLAAMVLVANALTLFVPKQEVQPQPA